MQGGSKLRELAAARARAAVPRGGWVGGWVLGVVGVVGVCRLGVRKSESALKTKS